MKIQQSQVQLAGQHEAARQHQVQSSVSMETRNAVAAPRQADRVDLSAEAMAAQQAESSLDLRSQLENNPLWKLIKQLVKKLTGRDIDLDDIVPSQRGGGAQQAAPASQTSQAANGVEWQVDYHYREEVHETEYTQFAAAGSVTTADGRRIDFSASLELYREYSQVSETRLTIATPGMKKDPLVINFNAPSASLSQDKIDFDVDADGKLDKVSFVGSGSGFLALDKNGDGKVNDGNELFGAQSGDGFGDLAQYDDDGNGWIDEGDAVWGQLKLWVRDEQGQDALTGLAAMGIGAIHLGSAQTDFSLTDQQNQEHAQIRRSGIYIREDGQLGTVQQIDLVA
ncbi:hypothetical protein [Chitinimonas koreensis]|uniref:hypothetical protein n=1 Tax=Chitinimonas koreensis TaxID=356302 RepID=UPI000411502F|nr:hypothetical protein [Chitinimonas koreensis]QNM94953.1 VCBS repeat-containing protein [Chitinimonas koreensis]